MEQKAIVIGAGIGGLSTAALMAKEGYNVTLLEKNDQIGGRARIWKQDGFTFDMGPSWYLMPEVFDNFFLLFGKKREDYYSLKKLDPAYRVFFSPDESVDVSSDPEVAARLFETFEPGGGARLKAYLAQAEYKYDIAMKEFLYRDYQSIFEFFNRKLLIEGSKLGVFSGLDKFVRKYFKDRRARQILEYAMVFLGTSPEKAPALYSIMSHLDLKQGVFYPDGGLSGVARAFGKLAEEEGVKMVLDTPVTKIRVKDGVACAVETVNGIYEADVVVSNADYPHTEMTLLDAGERSFSKKKWEKKVLAPSMFILYLGLNKRLENFTHHNLYFSSDWNDHFDTIFTAPSWPEKPCFYVSCISKTDPASAPRGGENVFVLVPVAPGLDDSDTLRETYADESIRHIEQISGESISDAIKVRRIYSQRDFINDYNAFQGTALGLSHTLRQTAVFRPGLKSRKVDNLFYAGQYTRPGVGVPMVVISAQLAAEHVKEYTNGNK